VKNQDHNLTNTSSSQSKEETRACNRQGFTTHFVIISELTKSRSKQYVHEHFQSNKQVQIPLHAWMNAFILDLKSLRLLTRCSNCHKGITSNYIRIGAKESLKKVGLTV